MVVDGIDCVVGNAGVRNHGFGVDLGETRLLDHAGFTLVEREGIAYRASVIAVVMLISTGQAHEAKYSQVKYFRCCAHFVGCDKAHGDDLGMMGGEYYLVLSPIEVPNIETSEGP